MLCVLKVTPYSESVWWAFSQQLIFPLVFKNFRWIYWLVLVGSHSIACSKSYKKNANNSCRKKKIGKGSYRPKVATGTQGPPYIESLVTDEEVKFGHNQPIIDVCLREMSALQKCLQWVYCIWLRVVKSFVTWRLSTNAHAEVKVGERWIQNLTNCKTSSIFLYNTRIFGPYKMPDRDRAPRWLSEKSPPPPEKKKDAITIKFNWNFARSIFYGIDIRHPS